MPYNQPTLSPCAQWDPNGITLTNIAETPFKPGSLFVDKNNTLYVADDSNSRLYIRHVNSNTTVTIILDRFFHPFHLFVTIDGNIYVSSDLRGMVEKWTLNATKGITVMNVSSPCWGLFVDVNNTIYCSLYIEHRVVKQSLDEGVNKLETVAGNGSSGSRDNMLSHPRGIFVDINFDLYVADCWNHRIQLFKFGELTGTTVVGNGAPSTITLHYPFIVFMDADHCLFIVDQLGARIIRSRYGEFRCIIGCSASSGHVTSQLIAAAFDSYGHIFVAYYNNDRIQKFDLMTNIFSK